MDLFKRRRLIIATKHNKEKVIAPILETKLGVECFVDDSFDTDTLGTFSGEVQRELDPLNNARKKCLLAMERTNCDLGIASEGSFGPHPSLFFASADDEFLILIDNKNNLEIVVRELSAATNFNARTITSEKDLLAFAEQSLFPSHALILKPSVSNTTDMIKGITTKESLLLAYKYFYKKYRMVYAETDMRALFNPSRMAVIKTATEKLVEKVQSVCTKCKTPGFGVTDAIAGLPCSLCGMPTASTKILVLECQNCAFKEERNPKHGKSTEDPMYCNYCNP